MKKVTCLFKYLILAIFVMCVTFTISYSSRDNVHEDQKQRLDSYVNSDNMYIAEMFFDENKIKSNLQPALVQNELYVLDKLVDRIDKKVLRQFDQKFKAWLLCWAPMYSTTEEDYDIQELLKCNDQEFKELIDFCRQQDDDVFLLLYQLAARANCPFDQLLLRPVNDLLDSFPEFSRHWREIDLSLQSEKPDMNYRSCNESTIWHTRKIIETNYKHRYTYPVNLTMLIDKFEL